MDEDHSHFLTSNRWQQPAETPNQGCHITSMCWAQIDTQIHCCRPSSGFISITISTQKIPSPMKQPYHIPSSSNICSMVKNDKAYSDSPVLISCKATMVKVTECRKRYEVDQENTSFSHSKRPTFSSTVHLEILSSQSSSSTFYLYKLLTIPVCIPKDNRHSVHRSSHFLSITKLQLVSSLEKPQDAARQLLKPSERNIIDCNVTVEKTLRADMVIVKPRTSRGDNSSDSLVQLANLSPLPFRARCHSSSEAIRVNEKANDVSGTLWSNQMGHVEGPGRISAAFLAAVPANGVKQSLSFSLMHFLSLHFHTISDDNEVLVSLNTSHNILASVVPL